MLHSSRSTTLALVAAAALLTSCAANDPAASQPSPSPTNAPSPAVTASPSPTAAPVKGAVELSALRLEPHGRKLHPRGSVGDQAVEVDEPAVRDFAGAVARWLDTHLTTLQAGAAAELPAALAAEANPEATAAVTTALASPDAPVTGALYVTEVAVEGGPRWAHVVVTVTHPDASSSRAEFVFVPSDRGPELIAAGPVGQGRGPSPDRDGEVA